MEVNRQESISIRTPRRRSPPACSTAFVPFVFSTTMCTRLLTRGCPSAPSWTTTILRLLTSPSMPSISSFVIAYGALISITATTFPLTTSSISGVIHHWLDRAQASIRTWERAPETKESGRPDYFVQAMEDFLRSWVNLPVWEVKRTDVWGVRLSIRFAYWLMYYDIEMYLDQTTDLVCVDWQHERRIDAPDEGEPLLGDMERKLVETMLEQVSALVVRMQPPPDVIQDYPAVG